MGALQTEFFLTHTPLEQDTLLGAMAAAALEAGRITLGIYQGEFEVRQKADLSPVTQADQAAEAFILQELARVAPSMAVVAEESAAAGHVPAVGEEFFLVDPLDGTKEFISRNGEFTVNIALISAGTPRLGVVYAPVSGTLYLGDVGARQAFCSKAGTGGRKPREPIHVRPVPARGLTAVVSRSHGTSATEAYLARYRVAERVSIGSSLKFCLVAAGEADLYPRIGGPTMEWDTAAGHAVLAAAGGAVQAPGGVPLRYGKPGFRNPSSFVATGPLEPLAVEC
jgi:3'(2'), 5'-bisphosphate nucleotidase